MQVMLDTANIKQIETAMQWGFLDGVTTNPTILARELGGADLASKPGAKALFSHLDKLRDVLGDKRSLHAQTTGTDCRTIVEEGKLISSRLGKNTYIKIPVTVEGLKAIRILHEEGCGVTATAIISIMQGLLASYAGADYAAVYYSRMYASGIDAKNVIKTLCERFDGDLKHTRMLTASFKNPQDVADCYALGAHCCTIPFAILEASLTNPLAENAVDKFSSDWKKVFGEPYTVLSGRGL